MTEGTSFDSANGPDAGNGDGQTGWAHGLRQLYDWVVNEPLPDSFRGLFARLEE